MSQEIQHEWKFLSMIIEFIKETLKPASSKIKLPPTFFDTGSFLQFLSVLLDLTVHLITAKLLLL
jgi:hypothetical protein